jgi:colanic acid biosynthesis glycosyl transferase WcaI
MRLLILTLWYYPEPVAKPHDLAMELVKRGNSVTVITGFPNYPKGIIYEGYRVQLWQCEVIDGVKVVRLPFIIDRSGSGLRRLISYFSFTVMAVLASFFVRRVNVIWTYQIGLPGLFVKWFKRIHWIHEVQDLWPDWAQTADMGLRPWWFGILERQEKFIYRVADTIVTISDGFRRVLSSKKGVPLTKIQVLPNWANEENFRPVVRDPDLADREGLSNRFNIMYVGNIGIAQALSIVLDSAEILRDISDVQFVLIGDGVDKLHLEEEAVRRRLHNVRFLGSRSQSEVASYIAWADLLFIHLMRKPEYEITIPSKTYAYLASGRPILAAATGDVAQLLEEIDAGIVCPPENAEELAAAIQKFRLIPEAEQKTIGLRGRQAFLTKFVRNIAVDSYTAIFEECSHID